MKQTILLTLLSALVLTSCQQNPSGSDAEDERNPFFRQASKDVADLNYPAAIKQFEKAVSGELVMLLVAASDGKQEEGSE